MAEKLSGLLLGDAIIRSDVFEKAWNQNLGAFAGKMFAGDWETNYDALQRRRLAVEQQGPEIEPCEPLVLAHGREADVLLGTFLACSSAVMEAMPQLRILGVSRAGLENVNLPEATRRGILVFHVMGRNAQAVSDFAIGMMLCECRNIARAHYAIKNGQWRKQFVNTGAVPELNGRTVGLVGFGYIGTLVAKKLSGFDAHVIVYDPYADPEQIRAAGCTPVGLDELFESADFISLHARLTEENQKMVDARRIALMKPTAYLINTGRAGLVDNEALLRALQERRIMGAALDVFDTEPLGEDSPWLSLDNVTLTTHLGGMTADALGNSPFLLTGDIRRLLDGEKPRFLCNPEVLEDPRCAQWLAGVQD